VKKNTRTCSHTFAQVGLLARTAPT